MDRAAAIELVRGLVAIPSISRHEAPAAAWLVEQMRAAGYDRAFVDEAGNAVGELGDPSAARTIVLLGHIDTVPGNIPVRIEPSGDGEVLFGRGSVDAKGPLATFVAGAARFGASRARESGLRVVVVGAVEEEAATSKGARFIAARFNGTTEPVPSACIIGEPSHWRRVTLGYKGRLLLDLTADQPMAHTAGPDASVAAIVVDLWNWVTAHAARYNAGKDKAFDQLSPSLRRFITGNKQMHDTADAQIAWRLPLGFDAEAFSDEVRALAGDAWTRGQDGIRFPLPRLRAAVARRSQQRPGQELPRRGAHRRRGGAVGVRPQDRHERHERGRARLAMPDRRLRPRRQRAGSHAERAPAARRILARRQRHRSRAASVRHAINFCSGVISAWSARPRRFRSLPISDRRAGFRSPRAGCCRSSPPPTQSSASPGCR